MRRWTSLIGIWITWVSISTAQTYHFTYNDESQQINEHIINLKLELAQELLISTSEKQPLNLSHRHLQSYLDFFYLFISEEEAYFDQFQNRKKEHLDALKQLDDSDPYKQFAMAEIKLHSAIIRSKFGELLGASREVLSAYKLLSDNQKKFPDFIYNQKSLSVIHSLIETVTLPGIIKKLFGIKGSIAQGLEEIESVIEYSHAHDAFLFKEEADAIYTYMLYYQANREQEAIHYMHHSRLNPKASLLATFLFSKLSQRNGQNEVALQLLQQKPTGDKYSRFDFLILQEGICLLRAGDKSAIDLLKQFTQQFEGRHYIKSAYQKLAWASLIFDEDLAGYKSYMQKVDEEGHDLVDADKQALTESKVNEIPDPILLKARLLYDGGYYHKAMQLLTTKAYAYTIGQRSIEYNYRLGRVCQALKNYPDAIEFYSATIQHDISQQSYYTCNAMLQSGKIYESQKDYEKARALYSKCLDMNPNQYKNSLHQKAKTGLVRIDSK